MLARFSIPRDKWLRLAATLAFGLLTLAVLGYLVYRQREVLFSYPWQFRPLPLLASFVLFSIDLLLVAVIWGWIMNTLSSGSHAGLDLKQHVRIYCISNVTKRLPGSIWYIASRVQMYRSAGISIRLTSLASGMEMAVAVISGVLMSLLFAIPIIISYQVNSWVLVGILALGCVIIHPRTVAWIFRLMKVETGSLNYISLLKWLAAYLVAWLLGGAVLFAIGNSITEIPLRHIGYVIGSWSLVSVITAALLFLPSNFGVTEIGLSLFLSNIMPAPVAIILTVLSRILLILYEAVWALVFIARGNHLPGSEVLVEAGKKSES